MKYIIREKVSVKSGASAAVIETFSLGPWDTRAMAEEMINDLARVDELDPNCAGSRGSAKRGVTVVFEGESPKATVTVKYEIVKVPDAIAECVRRHNASRRHLEPEEMTMQEAWHQYLLDNGMSEEDYPLEEFMPSYLKGEP